MDNQPRQPPKIILRTAKSGTLKQKSSNPRRHTSNNSATPQLPTNIIQARPALATQPAGAISSIMAPPHNSHPPSASQAHLQNRTPLAPPAQVTPIPIPQIKSQIQAPQPQLHLQTKQSQQASQRPASGSQTAPLVARPPVSPLTPPPAKSQLAKPPVPVPDFATGRPTFTHSQPAQTAISPPQTKPIDFESNPDAIALRSAIAILQNQRNRAVRDIQALQKAKNDALEDPETFVTDLKTGKVRVTGTAGFCEVGYAAAASPEVSSDSSSDKDATPAESSQAGLEKLRRRQERSRRRAEKAAKKAADPAWTKLPGQQNVVRCPPINWTKYAVVGESLDKVHAEQLDRPPEGAPASIGLNGAYEFKAGDGTEAPGKKYLGIAAPYAPSRDHIYKKPKVKK